MGIGVQDLKRQVTQIKCIDCGANLEFSDKGSGKLICPTSVKKCKVLYFSTTDNKFHYVEGHDPTKNE